MIMLLWILENRPIKHLQAPIRPLRALDALKKAEKAKGD
jgi:hypothetical protein